MSLKKVFDDLERTSYETISEISSELISELISIGEGESKYLGESKWVDGTLVVPILNILPEGELTDSDEYFIRTLRGLMVNKVQSEGELFSLTLHEDCESNSSGRWVTSGWCFIITRYEVEGE